MGSSTSMQIADNMFNASAHQPGAPDDVMNNCGAPGNRAAADSSADDSDDEGGSSGSDTAAQLLLQFAADHKHQKHYELNSTDDTGSRHRRHSKGGSDAGLHPRDATVEKRMKARRESARVRRARRKESTQHLDQENAELRQNIKQLQHTLATVNPSLPITAFYHRNPHAAFGDSAAAATHAAAVAAIVAPNRKTRVHGEKMTVEELKQARREAAHRSREREKVYRQALEDDNAMLHQEYAWLQQQLQWQVQKLNGATGTTTVLVYNPAGAVPGAVAAAAAPAAAAAATGQLAQLAMQQQQLTAAVSAAAGSSSRVSAAAHTHMEAAAPYMLAGVMQQQQQQVMQMREVPQPAAEYQPAMGQQQQSELEVGLGEAAAALMRKLAAIRAAPLAAPAAPAAAAAPAVAAAAFYSNPTSSSKVSMPETAVASDADHQSLEQQLQQLSDAAGALLRQHGVPSPELYMHEPSAHKLQQQQQQQQGAAYEPDIQPDVPEQMQVDQQQQAAAAAVAPVQQQQQQQAQEEQMYAEDLQKEQLLQLLLQQMIETAGAIQRMSAGAAPNVQQQQQQGKAELEQRLKRLSDAAAALLLSTLGSATA